MIKKNRYIVSIIICDYLDNVDHYDQKSNDSNTIKMVELHTMINDVDKYLDDKM